MVREVWGLSWVVAREGEKAHDKKVMLTSAYKDAHDKLQEVLENHGADVRDIELHRYYAE